MSTITILGNPRSGCTGPTRGETLKIGALSLLGGMFHTGSLLAAEQAAPQFFRPARAKNVVLLYLQGGAPTQDMFNMKPEAKHLLGIDPETPAGDRANHPIAIAHGGRPVQGILT